MGSLLTGRQAGRTTAQETEYWDRIAREWPHQARTPLWRQHSDRVNGALLARWLPRRPMGFVLKTDLFEEAVGDGLYPLLPQWARSAIGIDLSHTAVARAMRRHRQLKGLVADVRRLPFKSGSFDSSPPKGMRPVTSEKKLSSTTDPPSRRRAYMRRRPFERSTQRRQVRGSER